MSFLAPFFLLGALAVALPILLHLIRRTSREKISFSSLLFLQPTPPRLTRRSRLENIWLLILRCLMIGLLTFGFARPYWQKPMAPDLSGGGARKILILLDTSASMRREGVWAEAVKKAQAVLDGASAVDQVALYSFDRQMRAELTFEQWANFPVAERVAIAGRRLTEIKPGWGGTHLGNALTRAAELFEDAHATSAGSRRQIILISDLQEGSRLDGLQGYEWPRGLEAMIEPVKSRRVTNAGLQLVADREEKGKETEKGATEAPAHIRVSNASDSKGEQFKIAWSDPKIPGSNQTMDVYVPRGQSRIFSAPKIPTNAQPDQLLLTGDESDFDNRVYFIPPRTEHLNILFLGADSDKDPAQVLFYLERAFPETRRQAVKVTAHAAKGGVPTADVDAAQLLVVGEKLPPEQVTILSRFLKEGKTVLVALQSAGAAESLTGIPGLENFTAEEAPKSEYTMFGQIDFQHPLFAPFADPRFSDFTKIHFWRHRRVSAEKIPGARVVARFDDGDPAVLHFSVGKGALFVLTSSWSPADSQLALSSKFVPLLYSILDLGGNLRVPPAQYLVGDEVTVAAAGSTVGRALTVVRKPDGKEVEIKSGDGKFSETDLPGIYQVMATQPPERFAVNLAAEESKTGPMPIEELDRLGVPLKVSGVESPRQAEQKKIRAAAAELEGKQKLWRWLIVAALMVLIVETWLAGKLTRGSGVQTEASL